MATAVVHRITNFVVNTLNPKASDESVNQRVGKVYAYAAQALGVTAISAVVFAKIGFTATVLSAAMSCPILAGCALIAIGVSLIAATILIPKKNFLLKYGCYGLFTVFEGLALSPLVLVHSTAFVTATLAATALTGGLGVLAMKLKHNFEKYETILMVALGGIALASIGALALPVAAAAVAHEISYLGGFALFSLFVIHDTQKARSEARFSNFDPLERSMDIYLDTLNLVVRIGEMLIKHKKIVKKIL